MGLGRGSVSRRYRGAVAAEAIIETEGQHVHVLADSGAEDRHSSGSNLACCEGGVVTSHPEVVVFDTERPVRGEAILPADTQGTTPARVFCRGQADPGEVVEYIKTIVRHRGTALHV